MSYEVTLTPEAKHDLREIYRYIAVELQSEQNANGQLDRLEENILKLDEMPERFRVYDREPWSSRNLRVMPVDNYLVFYIPAPKNARKLNRVLERVESSALFFCLE